MHHCVLEDIVDIKNSYDYGIVIKKYIIFNSTINQQTNV
tara:strand:+ start:162941 stop:163057 length:117 start_codon:yes stop_codon:yes gene_type:complete